MYYFYISREAIKRNEVLVYDKFMVQVELIAYRTGLGKEDAILYVGENIPNDITYDEEQDIVFSLADRPSPYHTYVFGEWVLKDIEGYKNYCNEKIDKIKADTLDKGFMYKDHVQKCRPKDIAYMVATVTSVNLAKTILNIDKTITWYFEDNFGLPMNIKDLSILMLTGTTFVQAIFDAESYFKNLETPKEITVDEFEEKVSEIQNQLIAEGGAFPTTTSIINELASE